MFRKPKPETIARNRAVRIAEVIAQKRDLISRLEAKPDRDEFENEVLASARASLSEWLALS